MQDAIVNTAAEIGAQFAHDKFNIPNLNISIYIDDADAEVDTDDAYVVGNVVDGHPYYQVGASVPGEELDFLTFSQDLRLAVLCCLKLALKAHSDTKLVGEYIRNTPCLSDVLASVQDQ